jgi:hypothetical protein
VAIMDSCPPVLFETALRLVEFGPAPSFVFLLSDKPYFLSAR